ncbi:hypothetical protein ACOHYD_06230 [Desulfobacterota bacterium M19]
MLARLKPGVSRRVFHFAAAFVWSAVGIMLFIRGSLFLHGVGQLWLLFPAIAIGSVKSIFMLDKAAKENLRRLRTKNDGNCLGGVYTVKMWGLIAVMIFLGWLLRTSSAPRSLVGIIYAAIGWALFFSSRVLWDGFKKIAP